MNKRVLFILLPLIIGFSIVGGIYFTAKPYIQHWLLSQVNRFSEEKLPVLLQMDDINWSLLPVEIQFRGVRISEKPGAMANIPETYIDRASASLDLLAIFAGKIAISTLVLEEPRLTVDLDPFLKVDGPSKPLPLKDFFNFLKKMPVTRLGIRGARIDLISKKYGQTLSLNAADLLAVNQKERISLQIDLQDSLWKQDKKPEIPVRLQGDLVLNPQALDISMLKLNMFNTVAQLSGSFKNVSTIHIAPEGTINFEVFAELPQLWEAIKGFAPIGKIKGVVKTAGRIEFGSKGLVSAGVKFSGQKIQYEKFDIGNVIFDADFKDNVLNIPQIQITGEAGLVDIYNLQMKVAEENEKKRMDLSLKLQSNQFDIREFLIRMGLKDLPIEVFASTEMNCQGPVYPEPLVECKGSVTGEQIEVRTGPSVKDTLVNVESVTATGDVKFTNKMITYKADLELANNKGTSEGSINYKEGFKIKFASPEFDFANLGRTSGLKIEGITSLEGVTSGNTDAATLSVNFNAKNAFFEDFKLGDVGGQIRYERSVLYFENLKGQIGDPSLSSKGVPSQYQGNLQVNLNTKRIAAAASVPQYEVSHLLSVFERRFQLPVQITGNGSAEVSVEGPFSLGLLSYNLKTKIEQGLAADESFDEVEVEMISNSGNMSVQKAILRKNRSEVILTGSANPEGIIDLKITGHALPLENSENISKLGAQISGLLDLDMTLKGFVMTPDTLLTGRVRNLTIEERDFPDSIFSANLSRQNIRGDLSLFAGQLNAQYTYPLTENSSFMLKGKATEWNYAPVFILIGGGSLINDYQTRLSGEVNLQSPQGGFWTSTGKAILNQIILERGNLSLRNKSPIEIEMQEGVGKFKNFRIESTGTDKAFFDAKSEGFSRNDLRMQINGVTNIRLFQIFVPFLEDLGGTVKIDINTAGSTQKPEILGTAKIEEGFVKMKVFPHPFERINAEVQFSQSKVLINQFTGNLAGGRIAGDGSILIQGPKQLPVNVKAKFEDVNLNFPSGMRTVGDGDLSFTGSWFPYVFSGTYHVRGGFIDKEFQDEAATNALKQSAYLPKTVLQSSSDPLLLDLNIILERPLPVKNSMIDGTVTGNIQVRGPPTQFSLGGRISTERGSKAIARDKVFQIQTGTVQFNNSPDINPEIYLSANSRISQYDISLLVQGSAKSPSVRFSSTPPLSDQDIISLIALGVTSNRLEKQIDNTTKSEQATNQAIGGAALAGVLTQFQPVKKLQQTAGVEIQFSSTSDDTKNISLQRITLSKKLSDKARAAATQVSGNYSALEYTLQYNLTDNFSAIGRYEDRKPNETTGNIESRSKESQSIFGLDFEFKREFK